MASKFNIFITSVFYAIFVLIVERSFGVPYDYHPDSLTYLSVNPDATLNNFINNPLSFWGSFYYVFVAALGSSYENLLLVNVAFFALTNTFLFSVVSPFYNKHGVLFFLSAFLLIFDPYRAHLAVHTLKDTLIIFSLVAALYFKNPIIKIIFIFAGSFFRFAFFVYIPIFISYVKLNSKVFSFLIIVSFISVLPFYDLIFSALQSGQSSDMSFRDFDRVPSFLEFGFPLSDLLRAAFWPIIRLSGLAFVFSPVYLLFLPTALALMYLFFKFFKSLPICFYFAIIPLLALAYSVSGYNSYLRYTAPVITAITFIIFKFISDNKHARIL